MDLLLFCFQQDFLFLLLILHFLYVLLLSVMKNSYDLIFLEILILMVFSLTLSRLDNNMVALLVLLFEIFHFQRVKYCFLQQLSQVLNQKDQYLNKLEVLGLMDPQNLVDKLPFDIQFFHVVL